MVRNLRRAIALALLALAGTVGTAGASTLRFEPAGRFALTSLLATLILGGTVPIQCAFSFTGSLDTGAIPDTPGRRVGQLEGFAVSECTGGGFVIGPTEMPWQVEFVRKLVVLPYRLYGLELKIRGANFVVAELSGWCLYRGDVVGLVGLDNTNPYEVGLFDWDLSQLTRVSGPAACPATVTFAGWMAVSPEQTVTEI